jgi:hypothetical protein
MSASWTVTGNGVDEDPQDVHHLACQVWTTNDQPCNCADLRYLPMPEKRLLTTAERLDLLLPCDEQAS